MVALVGLVLTVGLVDSLNPSTIAPALYLATGPEAIRRLGGLTAGIFAVSFVGGIVLTLGPGQAIVAAVPRPGATTVRLLELALGGAAALLAAFLWIRRDLVTRHLAGEQERARRSAFVLGAAIMSVELPSALPYFAVIAAIVGSGRAVADQVLLLTLFNAAFVAPLGGIAAVKALAGTRGEAMLGSLRTVIDKHAAVLVPAAVAVIAAALLAAGAFAIHAG